ncbi:hypothetical protein LTR56_019713 [Elasticomyces elasticus]|nr:hypothetical protein LTR56_019713 [Elasticomyces elasticus]KAK3655602.1 hypothetical protein LTR22_010192 [Elasticomyces elasticus]KAK4925879.1 hypothetical protein LTR49_007256 [Elasticomyces elasticus]KAK5764834.1 hypothetical protein LTS12_005104 [Elasticomyces elasticus]
MSTTLIIAPATAANAQELAQLMISAYQDDEMYQTAFGRAAERSSEDREQEERLFRQALFAGFVSSPNILLFKAVDPMTGRIIGYADWMVPTKSALVKKPEDVNPNHCSTSTAWPAWINRQLLESGDALLNESRDRLLGERHRENVWKLCKVVVLPERRGEGVGRQLLGAGLEAIDGEGRDVFLHSTTVARKLFESSRFEVLEEVEVMNGYCMTAMLRKAHSRVA